MYNSLLLTHWVEGEGHVKLLLSFTLLSPWASVSLWVSSFTSSESCFARSLESLNSWARFTWGEGGGDERIKWGHLKRETQRSNTVENCKAAGDRPLDPSWSLIWYCFWKHRASTNTGLNQFSRSKDRKDKDRRIMLGSNTHNYVWFLTYITLVAVSAQITSL